MPQLFPMIGTPQPRQTAELPLYREADWDFERRSPLFRDGAPVFVTGARAVRVWAWKALLTQRTRFEIYSWDYGCEVESLIGQNYTEQLKRSEAVRYVREALEINPYITQVTQVSVGFADSKLRIELAMDTIYGEVQLSV